MGPKRKVPILPIQPWFNYSDCSIDEIETPTPWTPAIPTIPVRPVIQLPGRYSKVPKHGHEEPAPVPYPARPLPDNIIEQSSDSDNDTDTVTDTDEANKDYKTLLEGLSSNWLLLELNHQVSKTAVNEFWRLAISQIPALLEAKQAENCKKKSHSFSI